MSTTPSPGTEKRKSSGTETSLERKASSASAKSDSAPVPHRDERNFRSHYYEKVGFRGVDEKKTIELLLSEDPISISKCSNFALKYSVPSHKRMQLWKLILGKKLMGSSAVLLFNHIQGSVLMLSDSFRNY